MNPSKTEESKLPFLVQGNFHAWQKFLHAKIAPTLSAEIGNQIINEKSHVIVALPTRKSHPILLTQKGFHSNPLTLAS